MNEPDPNLQPIDDPTGSSPESDRSHAPLGELQLAILGVLWNQGQSTVVRVHGQLTARGVSASTIGTMLQKMERRGLVGHHKDGRRYLYHALVSAPDVRRGMVGELTRRLFGGDPLALLAHLVREQELGSHDLERLKAEIARREKEQDGMA